MSDSANRKPIAPAIAAILIGLAILYVAMPGPLFAARYYFDLGESPEWIDWCLNSPDAVYWLIKALPEQESDRLIICYSTYLEWWAGLGATWRGGENARLYTMP